jgi:hypothetical protein
LLSGQCVYMYIVYRIWTEQMWQNSLYICKYIITKKIHNTIFFSVVLNDLLESNLLLLILLWGFKYFWWTLFLRHLKHCGTLCCFFLCFLNPPVCDADPDSTAAINNDMPQAFILFVVVRISCFSYLISHFLT